jgi:hypothetical protein
MKLSKEQMLSELMVKLETIDGKIDKLLTHQVQSAITGDAYLVYGNSDGKPPRWSNESYENYLKRIGEYNTAQSDEEIFKEECK